ncbi:hypothetical protein SFR_1316 [Streptomyces sp. FR-008]|nr:hypothetical protein SFR_1316 [Streptomyces sp. FR-008]
MLLHRALGYTEAVDDSAVRQPGRHEFQYLAFSGGEQFRRVFLARTSHELLEDVRVQHGLALTDPVQSGEELREIAHPLLEQVTRARRCLTHQFLGVRGLHVLREEQDGRAGVHPLDLDGGANAFVGVGRRHPDIHDDHVRPALPHHFHNLRRVAQRSDDVNALVREQPRHSRAQERGILSDRDAHGDSR